jgi:hypothetical protein
MQKIDKGGVGDELISIRVRDLFSHITPIQRPSEYQTEWPEILLEIQ